MKHAIVFPGIVFFAGLMMLTGCQQNRDEMMRIEKDAVADTVNIMMADVISSAEALDAMGTTDCMMMDSTTFYYFTGHPFSHCDFVEFVSEEFKKMDSQKFKIEHSHVYVLSREGAVWVGYGVNIVYDPEGKEYRQHAALTALWQKKNGKWGIYHLHESLAPVDVEE